MMLGGEDRGRMWRGIGWAGSGGGASAAARSDRKGEHWCRGLRRRHQHQVGGGGCVRGGARWGPVFT